MKRETWREVWLVGWLGGVEIAGGGVGGWCHGVSLVRAVGGIVGIWVREKGSEARVKDGSTERMI